MGLILSKPGSLADLSSYELNFYCLMKNICGQIKQEQRLSFLQGTYDHPLERSIPADVRLLESKRLSFQ
jgi:hypothetical protein